MVGYDQCILFAWEWSTEIDFNGLPRYLWQIRHFGWFCMLCVCRYLAVKASAHNGVNAIVHGREPILSVQHFFGLADTQVSVPVGYLDNLVSQ